MENDALCNWTKTIFVKSHGFLSNMSKYIDKNLSGEYSQKLLDHAKKSATDALKLLQKGQFEATGDLISNKIADVTKTLRTSPKNISETVKNEAKDKGFDKEISKERYISRKKTKLLIT